jgi:uncharacterized protein
MLIGIISDTHDNAINLEKAVKIFNKVGAELVIHCGDWVSPFMPGFCKDLKCKMVSVFGNNEGDKQNFFVGNKNNKWNIDFYDKTAEINIDNKNMIVYHGDSKQLLKSLIDSKKYDVVLSGHTHVPLVEKVGKILHINPGTTCGISESKITNKETIAIYDTKTDDVEIRDIE